MTVQHASDRQVMQLPPVTTLPPLGGGYLLIHPLYIYMRAIEGFSYIVYALFCSVLGFGAPSSLGRSPSASRVSSSLLLYWFSPRTAHGSRCQRSAINSTKVLLSFTGLQSSHYLLSLLFATGCNISSTEMCSGYGNVVLLVELLVGKVRW